MRMRFFHSFSALRVSGSTALPLGGLSLSGKRAQPNLVTGFAPRDSLPRLVESHVIPAKAGIHLMG
jgi:hypothetical protein